MTRPTRDQYREAAQRLYETAEVTVSRWGTVQQCQDGAYVELVAWVPREALTATPETRREMASE